MDNYDETLELFNRLQNEDAAPSNRVAQRQSNNNGRNILVNESNLDEIENSVWGKYIPPPVDKTNGAERLKTTMNEIRSGEVSDDTKKRINENVNKLAKSGMPTAILNEIISNPLIMDQEALMQNETEMYAERFGFDTNSDNAGVSKVMQITEKLETNDRNNDGLIPNNNVNIPNMSNLEQIIESVFDRKISEYSNRLVTESIARMPNAKWIKMKENGDFLLVDTDDNVYECEIRYKGKNKAKKK